jgi:hypothetical protein
MRDDTQPGRTRLLFLSLVRLIVEKHGGHLDIDEKNETFTVHIPQERKIDCIQELRNAVGPLEQVRESFVPIQ